MKIKEGFILRKVAGVHVVATVGEATNILNGMIKLNDTGAFLFDLLMNGISYDELKTHMIQEYDVSVEQATEDLDGFLNTLREIGCLEE
ncbi:MAG: PqqD family protein [Erysipelotrichaceae bacterium]|nr:PqqD family protein [Erysipelotrichaceae bacterium]